MAKKEIPVYLFLGFLESGKTRFIQETLGDPRFDSGDKTLLLVCEEGEEEYDPEKFAFGGVEIRTIEDKEDFTAENLDKLCTECGAGRVVMEYNGMWLDQELTEAFPENWIIYQTICCVDGTTFKTYFENMRQLMLDKFAVSELIVVNRADGLRSEEAQQYIHNCVRQASRAADIAYELADGSVSYDEIPDELPFDLDADIVEIGDQDYGVWFLDVTQEPQKYEGKTVRFTAQVCQTPQVGKNEFVPGRFVMTCCAEDIQFMGLPCAYEKSKTLVTRNWIKITASIQLKYHKIFGEVGPVLTAISVEPAEPVKPDYVTLG